MELRQVVPKFEDLNQATEMSESEESRIARVEEEVEEQEDLNRKLKMELRESKLKYAETYEDFERIAKTLERTPC